MITIIKNSIVKSQHHQKPIVTDIFYNNNQQKKPLVIFCHGYKGYKDWGAWNLVAKKFAKKNCFFIKFNFSHNGGTLDNPIDFPDLQTFANNNYVLELQDLEAVISWATTVSTFKNQINPQNIVLIGHSRGGGIVTIKAAENKKVSKVISWCGVSDFAKRFPTGKELNTWKEKGVYYVDNARTKQRMPHHFQFFENFKENEERLTIQKAVSSLKIPYLIVHGTNDEAVTITEAQNLNEWYLQSKLLIIDEMNHTLGSKHPWNQKKLPIHLAQVVEESIQFIHQK
jgi:pimeloyl-ACP methyl ester carboxylesterase